LAPLPFVLIPYFLKKLGTSGYGTWAVFLAISGLTSLADLGLLTTLSKHVAELYALRDFLGLTRLINTGFALYLGIAVLLAGSLWLGSAFFLATLFRSSPVGVQELHVLWNYLTLLVVANVLTLLCSSVIVGIQRMDLNACLSSVTLLANAGLSALFLSLNWGVRGIIVAYVTSAWITLGAYIYLLQRLLPEITIDLPSCRWSVAKEILSFSLKTYTTQMAVVIHNQIEKIYLAHFVGVVQAGWYDISSDLALKLRTIPSLILGPIMPAASELNALDDLSRLEQLYYRAHKYLALIAVPLTVFVVFVSKSFIALWVGPTLSQIALPLDVLLIANMINLSTGPGLLTLVGKGRLMPGLSSAVAAMLLNLSISLILIWILGFQGAVIGTSISLLAGSLLFLYLFRRETNGTFPKVIRKAYLKPMLSSLAAVLMVRMWNGLQPSTWARLAMQSVFFGFAYISLLLASRHFDATDFSILEGIIPVRRFAKRIIPNQMLNWATRYFPIRRALKKRLHDSGSLLELGAGPVGIGGFRRAPFVGCDLSFAWGPTPPMLAVKATATNLPFPDQSFDAVVASDVLEHVPPEERCAIINEALRVTRSVAIFGFPCGQEAEKSDRQLAGDYDRNQQERPVWLHEHLMHPYPAESLFEDMGPEWEVNHFGNESVTFHYWTMRREMHRLWNYLFMTLLAFAPRPVEYLLKLADRQPYYRRIVVAQRVLHPDQYGFRTVMDQQAALAER